MKVSISVIAPGGLTANNTITHNAASVQFTGNRTAQCFFLGATVPNSVVKQDIITDNTCDFSGSTGKIAGIFVQTARASTEIAHNAIQRNIAIGNNVDGDCGLCVENDAGTMLGNTIGFNRFIRFSHGLRQ